MTLIMSIKHRNISYSSNASMLQRQCTERLSVTSCHMLYSVLALLYHDERRTAQRQVLLLLLLAAVSPVTMRATLGTSDMTV